MNIDLKAIRAAAEADKGQDRAFILLSVDILALLDRLEAAEKDAARMDWIAMHGSFGVDSVSGEVGGNGQKRIAATRKSIDAAMKEQK